MSMFRGGRLLVLILLVYGSSFVNAEDSGLDRLCQLYLKRTDGQLQRFNSVFRDVGKGAAHWQVALWQDLLFIQHECPAIMGLDREEVCAVGRHLLGAQRGFLNEQNWQRTATATEAPLTFDLGDQVDQFCGAPIMAVQGGLYRLAQDHPMQPEVMPPSPLAFNARAWQVQDGEKGSSASTKK